MEIEINEELEKIYNFKIEVSFVDFRQYRIYCEIEKNKKIDLIILYDNYSTFESNINRIVERIDNDIPKLFKNSI